RVVLVVEHVEARKNVASINYAFEPSSRQGKSQMFLDPMNPQSELSDTVLEVFADMIGKDHKYRRLLVSHYELWKQAAGDPAHPEHAKVRGPVHDDRTFRPAFPGRVN